MTERTKTEKTTRLFECELRAENDEKNGDYVTGRPIVYGSQTDVGGLFGEIIEPGALDATDLRDVRFLVNHNTDMVPLARSRRNNSNSTMQMEVDKDGLAIRVNLDTEGNTEAGNLYSAIKRGDISGMSFMFEVRGDEWTELDSGYPTRHIRDIGKVYEVSAVTFPAYEATTITARSAEALESARAALESEKTEAKRAELRCRLEKLTKSGGDTDE